MAGRRPDVFGSERHFLDHLRPVYNALANPGTFFTAPEEGPNPILVASYGDLKKVRSVGRTRIALMEHGYGQSYSNDHPSYAGGRDREDVGLFLVPNEHAAQRNRDTNPQAQVEIVGCPKLDELPQREGPPGQVVCTSFHFDAHSVAPEATGTLHHYRRSIVELAGQFDVIGHGHPRALPILARYYKRAKVELVPDFADVCRRSDVYVCDNSSTLYEYASTGRPVVVLNAPHYRRNLEHGLRFWQAANVGVQVNEPSELADAIRYALTDPPEQRALREAALDMVYAYRSGAAQRAAKVLEAWAQ